MKVDLIEGIIKISLIIVDRRKLDDFKEALMNLSPEDVLDFLPSGAIVKNFELNQESREVSMNINAEETTS
jgi:hypothetical protein